MAQSPLDRLGAWPILVGVEAMMSKGISAKMKREREAESARLSLVGAMFHARHRNHEFTLSCAGCSWLDSELRKLGCEPPALAAQAS
jgi:hypothetical protein